jgi:SAM-dependent methyltransferase
MTALDRFDADYIEQGGRALLARNLGIAGLSERVELQTGDLTDLPFAGGLFDGAVSAHAMDHLGRGKEQGLREIHRVLKPGGRFLMVVWVPGWAMFAVASLLSLGLTTKAAWRAMFKRVGFELHQEGSFNGHWFAVLEKPVRRTD